MRQLNKAPKNFHFCIMPRRHDSLIRLYIRGFFYSYSLPAAGCVSTLDKTARHKKVRGECASSIDVYMHGQRNMLLLG